MFILLFFGTIEPVGWPTMMMEGQGPGDQNGACAIIGEEEYVERFTFSPLV